MYNWLAVFEHRKQRLPHKQYRYFNTQNSSSWQALPEMTCLNMFVQYKNLKKEFNLWLTKSCNRINNFLAINPSFNYNAAFITGLSSTNNYITGLILQMIIIRRRSHVWIRDINCTYIQVLSDMLHHELNQHEETYKLLDDHNQENYS